MAEFTSKLIAFGKSKFTAIAKAIRSVDDWQAAIAEATSQAKPYFIEFIDEATETCYRAIGWNNKATGKVDCGSWSHKIPKTIPELEALVAAMPIDKATSVFALAYAQYCIKMDAVAVKPKSLDAEAKATARAAAEMEKTITDNIALGKKLESMGIDPEKIEETVLFMVEKLPVEAKNRICTELGLEVSFS